MTKLNPASRWFPAFLVLLVMSGAVSSDIYLPSMPDMAILFSTTAARVQLTISVFFAGFAAAQLVLGPLSDRFGRRPVLLWGIVLYFFASLVCLFANSVELLIVGRFFQSLGACAGPVISRAVVRDVYAKDQAAKVFATIALIFAVTPAIAPIIGGHLHAMFGWHSNFIVMAAFGLVQFLSVWLFLEESNKKPDKRALSPPRMYVNYAFLLRDPVFVSNTLMVALIFSCLFILITGLPLLLIGVMGIRPEHFGYYMMGMVSGLVIGSIIVTRYSMVYGGEKLIRLGLGFGIVGGFLLALFGWIGVEHPFAVILPGILLFIASSTVCPCATALAIAPHARNAGLASALLGFTQMITASILAWFASWLHNGTTLPITSTVFGVAVLAIVAYLLFRPKKSAAPTKE